MKRLCTETKIRSEVREAAAGVTLLLDVFRAHYHVTLSHRCLLKSISFGDTVRELSTRTTGFALEWVRIMLNIINIKD